MKKILIISKLGIHKMYKKFKSVRLFMQPAAKSGMPKITKIGKNRHELLKNAKNRQGYVL